MLIVTVQAFEEDRLKHHPESCTGKRELIFEGSLRHEP